MSRTTFALAILASILLTAFTPLTYGVFRNDSSVSVLVTLIDFHGHSTKQHLISAHSTARFPIIHGIAVVSDPRGKPFSRCELMPVSRLQRYYDFAARSYYFRVTASQISPVLPKDAKTWNTNGSNQAMERTADRRGSRLKDEL